ncbi:uncharacterized protein LOC141525446 isoform X2 [Cotesia typhae]|uniref:uncharacterized protein LOC141524913 isoform X2 n=1 Tax=Cotesia typhae TaxID=2053667 RepID=UPI003D689F46
MVNKCIVDGCLSGRIKDRNKKLKLNSRNTSLFIVPQCPDLLKLWYCGLKQDLTPKKDYVCELHFNDQDIIKTDKILLTTGIYEELPRKRYSLKPDAIPTLNPNRVNKACNNENNEAQYMQCHLLITNDHKTNSPQNQEPIISNDLINIINCESPKRIDVFENFEENDNCENEMQPRELSTPELRLEKCSLLTIINVLKFNALPQNWSWTIDLVNPKNIVLCHLDKVSMNLKFRIKISEDFNISMFIGVFWCVIA